MAKAATQASDVARVLRCFRRVRTIDFIAAVHFAMQTVVQGKCRGPVDSSGGPGGGGDQLGVIVRLDFPPQSRLVTRPALFPRRSADFGRFFPPDAPAAVP